MKLYIYLGSLFVILFSNTLIGQGITSYSFNVLGLNTSNSKSIGTELKLFANADDPIIELDGFYNFKGNDRHKLSVGLGFNYNFSRGFYDVFLPVQFEVYPLSENRRVLLVYEVAPELTDDFFLRHLFGFRFNLRNE